MAGSGRTSRVLGECIAGGLVVGCLGWTVGLWNTGFFGEEDGPLLWLGVLMTLVGSVVFGVGVVGYAAIGLRALARCFGAVTVALAWLGVAVAAGAAYVLHVDLAFVAIPVMAVLLWIAWSQPGT